MSKYPYIKSQFKIILAILAATMMCAVLFALPTSAADWTSGMGISGSGDLYYTISDAKNSSGTITISDGTLYVDGSANNITGDLEVVLSGSNSNLVWTADVETTHSVIISGAGASIRINGDIISSNTSNPALNITASAGTIEISNCVINHNTNTGNAVSISGGTAAVSIFDVQIFADGSGTAGDAIYVNGASSLSIGTAGSTTMISCTNDNTGHALNLSNITNGTTITNSIIGNNASNSTPLIVSTDDLTINAGSTITSYHTAINQTGGTLTVSGGNITGGNESNSQTGFFGIHAGNATVILEGGSISTDSSDDEKDAAVHITGDSDLTIRGANIDGKKVYGVLFISSSFNTGSLTMTSGSVQARDAVSIRSAESVSLSGGTISGNDYSTENDEAFHSSHVKRVDIQNGIQIDGKKGVGVEVHDVDNPGDRVEFTMSGGTIKGDIGLHLSVFGTASITGGTITATGDSPEAGLRFGRSDETWDTPYTMDATISGNVVINGGASGIYINHQNPHTNLNIIGGTISASANGGIGIENINGTLSIAPTVSTPITVRGTASAIGGPINSANAVYYITSENYSGTPETGSASFVNSAMYKYIQFLAVAPVITPPPSAPPSYEPEEVWDKGIPDPIAYTEKVTPEWIEVIAVLNKSGSVNSIETVKKVETARLRADKLGVNKIKLIIPRGGTGISASAMKKVYKAAGNRNIYLTFDFYETLNTKEPYDLGGVFVKLNSKSGQYLTKVYFKSALIDSAQNYITKKWKTDILGSFETANKSGWGDTAEVTASLEKLGLSADDGTRLYALIYDTKTKKWFQTQAIVVGDEVVVNTTRSGVFTIVNRPIN